MQLVQRLRDHDPSVTPAVQWLNARLAAQGTTADELVREEHQRQGAMNVTVRNAITSMRLISAVDWSELFESVSLVDETLREGSDFAAMDFPTRDRYRHAIEELARGSRHSELEVARHVIRATGREKHRPLRPGEGPRREEDPGYFLISAGRRSFEKELGFRSAPSQWLVRATSARRPLRLSADDRGPHRADRRAPAGFAGALGCRRSHAPAARAARPRARVGRGARAREPLRDDPARPEGAPRPRASRRRARGSAHDAGGAQPSDDAQRRSRSRSSGSRSTRWRAPMTISASRCSRIGRTPTRSTRRATTSGWPRPRLPSRA